jgi:hypothetical protein
MTTFDLCPIPWGGGVHGVQGQICDILTPASYLQVSMPTSVYHICNTLYAIVNESVIDSSFYSCNEGYRFAVS